MGWSFGFLRWSFGLLAWSLDLRRGSVIGFVGDDRAEVLISHRHLRSDRTLVELVWGCWFGDRGGDGCGGEIGVWGEAGACDVREAE